MRRPNTGLLRFVTVACALAVAAAACGGGDDDSSNGAATTTTTTSAATPTDDSAAVESLQRELDTLACDAGPIDGTIGPDTEAAIKRFQSAAALTVDGVVGPQTRAALTAAATSGSPHCRDTPAPPVAGSTTTSASNVPPCDQGPIEAGVTASLLAGEKIIKLNEFFCAITWTVSTPTVATPSSPDGVSVTVLLRWSGTSWQPVDRAVYCDAGQVPPAIRTQACTGV